MARSGAERVESRGTARIILSLRASDVSDNLLGFLGANHCTAPSHWRRTFTIRRLSDGELLLDWIRDCRVLHAAVAALWIEQQSNYSVARAKCPGCYCRHCCRDFCFDPPAPSSGAYSGFRDRHSSLLLACVSPFANERVEHSGQTWFRCV